MVGDTSRPADQVAKRLEGSPRSEVEFECYLLHVPTLIDERVTEELWSAEKTKYSSRSFGDSSLRKKKKVRDLEPGVTHRLEIWLVQSEMLNAEKSS